MSFLDIDEKLLDLLQLVDFDRTPLTDIKTIGLRGPCDIGLIEGGVCNAENVHVLREFRAHCKILVAMGACAVNGGLPAQRNHLDLRDILSEAPDPRGGEGRLLPARLPAAGGRDLEVPHRPDRRPHAAPRPRTITL